MFGFFERKKIHTIDRRRSLAGIPVLNTGVRAEASPGGRTRITIRLLRGHGFLAHFQPAVMVRTVKLDELGSFVFGQINGEKTTKEIIEAFIARYRVNPREAELSCVEFLKMLAQRRVISIVIK